MSSKRGQADGMGGPTTEGRGKDCQRHVFWDTPFNSLNRRGLTLDDTIEKGYCQKRLQPPRTTRLEAMTVSSSPAPS
ncbi:hypothetical protein OAA19_02960 [Rubripirellula sp.]|nr:hypothetical protein [Rubripirellula sp.]MDB4339050.1 hypothetical protein [Rubripirellula sp.]